LVGWSIGWLVGWIIGWSVGGTVGSLVALLVRSFIQWVDVLAGQSASEMPLHLGILI
jgi:uncharacterized membrane protein